MIIVNLMGGMGNQMFQYAFGYCLATRYNTVVKVDTAYLEDRTPRNNFTFREYDLDLFTANIQIATKTEVAALSQRSSNKLADKFLSKIFGKKESFILEPGYKFSQESFDAPDNSYLEGYWQSEKYFFPVREEIKKQFTFREPLSAPASAMMEMIGQKNAVAVNVRRGDFLNNPFHGTCNPAYYARAQDIMIQKVNDPHYFVFSDEPGWAEKNLQFNAPVTFVGPEYNGRKYQDKFRLMSACDHFIMPNSSFAWWAIYLNDRKEKVVIVPEKWSTQTEYDIHLDGWIKL